MRPRRSVRRAGTDDCASSRFFPECDAQRHRAAGNGMRPGDIYIFNDPYNSGGMHLPDIYLIKPVFFRGSVEGYATALVHHADLGGIAPGSMAVYATEIYQEGICIPFMKLYEEGKPNQTLLDMIAANVRIPRQVIGDLRAQVAGVTRGEQGLTDLLERYGAEEFYGYCLALHENAEAAMRRVIASIPDGSYEHEDYIDGLGEDPKIHPLPCCRSREGGFRFPGLDRNLTAGEGGDQCTGTVPRVSKLSCLPLSRWS